MLDTIDAMNAKSIEFTSMAPFLSVTQESTAINLVYDVIKAEAGTHQISLSITDYEDVVHKYSISVTIKQVK